MSFSVTEDTPAWIRAAAQAHRTDLLRYAYSHCQNTALAEDAVQETFVRLLEEDPARLAGHLKPWLFRVCRSRVIDAQRKDRRLTSLEAGTAAGPARPDEFAPDPARQTEAADTHAFLWEAVEALTPAQQEVMRLKFQAQLSYKEIAAVTGKTVNAVGVHLHTALSTLRTRLAQHPEW
ncbi:MAG: RNA polymerase sigma factor [Verrucomicrobiota bacterium]